MRRWARAAATAVFVAGCGHSAAAPDVALPVGGHTKGDDLTAAVRALCDSADQARTDPVKAGSTFYLRSHSELHLLAQALGISDRPQAARVLEAMYSVEQDVAATPPRPALAADLSAVAALAGSGLTFLHLRAPACTTRTQP
jgi:hypothetical protein